MSETPRFIEDNTKSVCSVPFLPPQVWSKDGQHIDLTAHIWRLRTSIDGGKMLKIDWTKLLSGSREQGVTLTAVAIVQLYIAHRIERCMAGTAVTEFTALKHFIGFINDLAKRTESPWGSRQFDWSELTEGIARAYLDHCVHHMAVKGNYFVVVRTLYEWGVAHGYSGFSADILRILRSIKAMNASKGHNVRFRHPTKGPFSVEEMYLIRRGLIAETGSVYDRVLVMLLLELGIRPHAAVCLTNGDFRCIATASGTVFELAVPRIKKGTAERATIRMPISVKLGNMIVKLQAGSTSNPLFHWLNPVDPERSISEALRRFANVGNLQSPRTGKRLHLGARRFRLTVATRMREQGKSDLEIAAVLDHSDTQCVSVYAEASSEIADVVAKAIDQDLEPLVNRFIGNVVESIEQGVSNGIPIQLIPAQTPHLPNTMMLTGAVGMCGRDVRAHGVCGLQPALSCYGCGKFNALIGGPHQELLDNIELTLNEHADFLDKRQAQHLRDVRITIRQAINECATKVAQRAATGSGKD